MDIQTAEQTAERMRTRLDSGEAIILRQQDSPDVLMFTAGPRDYRVTRFCPDETGTGPAEVTNSKLGPAEVIGFLTIDLDAGWAERPTD